MGFEIDYLPVGKSADEKSGDAIAMRFWDESPDNSTVITVDGGTRDSGLALVEHIAKYYRTSVVHLAVLTHPDGDHASGLRDILEQCEVGNLLLLIPWDHAQEILPVVQAADSRITANSIQARLKEAFPAALELVEYATEKGIQIIEPFAHGSAIQLTATTQVFFLGPSRQYYLSELLPNYECLPKQPAKQSGILEIIYKAAAKAIRWVGETWDKELLLDPGDDEVNSENNSSVILGLRQGNGQFLFSGDAGVPAFYKALTFGNGAGIAHNTFTFFHVPHHGSRHNVGPTLLNAMFGAPRSAPSPATSVTAFVSATKDDPKHPSRRVTNALNRRAVKVISTNGTGKWQYSADAPRRDGWITADTIPFYDQVEDIED